MKRSRWFPLLWAVPLLPFPQAIFAAAGCAATAEGAVLQSLRPNASPASVEGGFRVRDVVVDPLLHRAFVHVEQCQHPERPLVLLPFAVVRETEAPIAAPTPFFSKAPEAGKTAVSSGTVVAVAMGDEHMRLTVRGRLLTSAAIGGDVEVQLAPLLDEQPAQFADASRRVHGRLVTADRVEVEP